MPPGKKGLDTATSALKVSPRSSDQRSTIGCPVWSMRSHTLYTRPWCGLAAKGSTAIQFLSLKTEQEESSCTRTEGEAVIVRPLDGDRAAAVLNVERERLRVDGAVGSDGDRRIRGPIEWAARGHGQPGEAARDPRAAAVPRGREAGIDAAARLVEAPLLKDGHDDVGVVRVERDIGFGLRVGLRAGEAGEGIGADLLCGARTEGGRHLTVHDASEDQEHDGNPDDEPHQNPAWGYTLRGRRGSTLAAKGAARDAPQFPFPSRATVPSAEPAAVERAASPFA